MVISCAERNSELVLKSRVHLQELWNFIYLKLPRHSWIERLSEDYDAGEEREFVSIAFAQ